MNHRPFEDWLLEDQPLDPTQKRDLDAHLRTCETCRAIAESNLALRSARIVAPAPGFSARFQERLVLARRAQRRRTLLGTLFFSLGGLLLLACGGWFDHSPRTASFYASVCLVNLTIYPERTGFALVRLDLALDAPSARS
jgi:hypothetical protein